MISKVFIWNSVFIYICFGLAGGNQREKAREKAQKKQKEVDKKRDAAQKGANKGMTLEERRERWGVVCLSVCRPCCLAQWLNYIVLYIIFVVYY